MRLRSLRSLLLVAVGAAPFAAFSPRSAAETVLPRHDLDSKLAAVLCASAKRPSALPFTAWRHGVYDAQIEGQLLRRTDGGKGRLEDAFDTARSLSRVLRYRGLVAGACPDGSLFAAVTPSGKPLGVAGTRVEIPTVELAAHCREWRVDYAPAHGGKPRRLAPLGVAIETKPLKSGVLSVTCQPERPSWQGPVMWFLFPVGDGPGTEVPYLKGIAVDKEAAGGDLEALQSALATWLNQVRAGEGLRALTLNKDLSQEADLLAIDGKLTHNRTLLKHSAAMLNGKHWHFLGENRAKGGSLRDLTWLLWNSPRHRELLLSEAATGVGIGVKKIGPQYFTVLVMGQSNAPAVAKGVRPDGEKKTRL
jgi:uncharacterized protein YkwD